jgi:hypothetical protein
MATRLLTLILMLLIGHYAMATEEPTFEVLAETEDYEVRRYDAYIVAEVDVGGKSADNQGFRTLAGYIFGDNESSEKMQMTAPVESRDAGKSDEITYGFVMESKYTLETLPTPNNEHIRLFERPSRIVAVRQAAEGAGRRRYKSDGRCGTCALRSPVQAMVPASQRSDGPD